MSTPQSPSRGRPKSPQSLSNADRQRRYRERHARVKTGDRMTATIRSLAQEFGLDESQVTVELIRFALCNRDWRKLGFPRLLSTEAES